MISHLERTARLKVLLLHIMASLAVERSQYPLEQLCDFHVPAGTSLASQVLEGSGKAQWSGSAPVVSRQPCEVVSTGCPAEGPSGAESMAASAPRKRHLCLISTKA